MNIQASKRLQAANYKWMAASPRDLGLDSIRALTVDLDDDIFAYAAFDGETLEIAFVGADNDPDSVQFNVSSGQVCESSKMKTLTKKYKAPEIRMDHLVYLLAGWKSPGM